MTTRLVADVGGTNTRCGISRDGVLDPQSVRSFRNADYSAFDDVIPAFAPPAIDELVVAVAGPVSGQSARLTNRDWFFDAAALGQKFGAKVGLLNDLTALGQAVPHLSDAGVQTLYRPQNAPQPGQQSLVVGVGTGLNASPVLRQGDQIITPSVEMGHTALFLDIAQVVAETTKIPMAELSSLEECFSGRGYARIYEALTGRDAMDAPQDAADARARATYAHLLALLARNLMLVYMPKGGIYFAGGIARHVLCSPAAQAFCETFAQPQPLDATLSAPVHVILDDAAALRGCAGYQL